MIKDKINIEFHRLNQEIETISQAIQDSDNPTSLKEILKSKILIRDRLISNNEDENISEQDFSLQQIQPETALIANSIHMALMNCLKFTLFNSKKIKKAIEDLQNVGFTVVELDSLPSNFNVFTNKIDNEKDEQKKKMLIKYEDIGKWIVESVHSERSTDIYKMDYTWVMTEHDKDCQGGLSFNFCCDWRNLNPHFFRKKVRKFTELSTDKILLVINLVERHCKNERDFSDKYQQIFPDLFPQEEVQYG